MPRFNQKGITQILIILILLLGIIGGVFLVKHPTIFKPKAFYRDEIVFTDKQGIPLSANLSDPNVSLLLKLPQGWELPLNEGPSRLMGGEASKSASPSAAAYKYNIIKQMIIENVDDPSLNTENGIAGSPPLYIISNFKQYFDHPFAWRLKNLNPNQTEAQRGVRGNFKISQRK